jgi:Flp pilus assembly pilin Flp
MKLTLLRFSQDEGGGTALEYAWIAMLISIAALGAMNSIHDKMQSWYWPIVNNLSN